MEDFILFAIIVIIIVAIIFFLKSIYAYKTFVCPSCHTSFKYQNLKASTCPNCGCFLEDENEIRKNVDEHYPDDPRL